MGRFVQGLRRGEKSEDAAKAAGFALSSFCRRRRKDPDFALAWAEALEISNAPRLIKPGNGRRLQLRKTRRVRFTEAKKDVFLAHFGGTCDTASSAEAAGVCVSTVRNHRLKDPGFDARCRAALEQGYATLEEKAVRERLEALRKIEEGLLPTGEAAVEFERQMKLLAQWRRRDGSLGPRALSKESPTRWTFEEAMAVLEKRLKALRIPVGESSGGAEEQEG